MTGPRLEENQRLQLTGELAAALEAMVDQSCADMAPLWCDATREARSQLDPQPTNALGFVPSPRYRALSKGARSKYRSLAAWRHAVLWRGVRRVMEDPDFREAMEAVYFTPYPSNAPPYAWSSRASEAPGLARFPSAKSLKERAKEGCWDAVRLLRMDRDRARKGHKLMDEIIALLLRSATRDSLRDELKLEDLAEWSP